MQEMMEVKFQEPYECFINFVSVPYRSNMDAILMMFSQQVTSAEKKLKPSLNLISQEVVEFEFLNF